METAFESLITSYLENGIGVADNFLDSDLGGLLVKELLNLDSAQRLHPAGIGHNAKLLHDRKIRGDRIYWLDYGHENPVENRFFDWVQAFVSYLNRTCYTGITGFEFHYALYEEGSFYKKHLDQFRDNSSRAFSMIMYLNDNWQPGDGGELCIYENGKSQLIAPTFGKCVFFDSSKLEHEVLESHRSRMSITGWLRRD